jgi:plasmid stabilization system protein ParE
MTLRVEFRPEADLDVLEARDYYERQRETLGDQLVDELKKVVSLIVANPELFAVIFRSVRRTKLRRFPYVVYYRPFADRIEILAVIHGSRSPRTWKKRIED